MRPAITRAVRRVFLPAHLRIDGPPVMRSAKPLENVVFLALFCDYRQVRAGQKQQLTFSG